MKRYREKTYFMQEKQIEYVKLRIVKSVRLEKILRKKKIYKSRREEEIKESIVFFTRETRWFSTESR